MVVQVTEELYQKIKDYLRRNHMTQKQFLISLVETEIERNLTQRAALENTAVSHDLIERSAKIGENTEEQDKKADKFESDELNDEEAKNLDDRQDESEVQGMATSM